METNSDLIKEKRFGDIQENMKENNHEYSWFRVHLKSFIHESKVLFWGIVKNFRRIVWHSKKELLFEYIQVTLIIGFMMFFCYCVFSFVSFLV